MAGVSMKDIKNRIRSMQSTRQITKAMEMVAASKLRSAQDRAISSRPYFETLYATINDIADSTRDFSSPYLRPRKEGKLLCIVIAGDRGLAGGYNGNILRMAYREMQNADAEVLPIGKKAVEFFRMRGVPLVTEQYAEAADMTIGDCFSVARVLCDSFLSGQYSRVLLFYTHFASLLAQTPSSLPLLPLHVSEQKTGGHSFILYETGPAAVFDAIVPEYFGGVVYGALCESVASEQAARRTAMDSATKNADDIISDLSLKYNRARQGAITQEITEIVAGAEKV